MVKNKIQHVMIKGSKNGLTLILDESASFTEAMEELDNKLSVHSSYSGQEQVADISVTIQTGNRILREDQAGVLRRLVEKNPHLLVTSIDANVITLQESKKMVEQREITRVAKVIRSGQILEVKGDLLLVGDVNPGGVVKAGGNVFIMGSLRGRAFAGLNGNRESIISASVLQPTQMHICDDVYVLPDQDQEEHVMEFAYFDDEGQIRLDRLQVLWKVRPNLAFFEGGM